VKKGSRFIRSIQLLAVCIFFIALGGAAQEPSLIKPNNSKIHYTGRIDFSNPARPKLIGAGACLQVKFKGVSCAIELRNENLENKYNYMVTILDGQYLGRYKVFGNQTRYLLADSLENKDHTLIVCKATEAMIGYVEFGGLYCDKLKSFKDKRTRKIELIGDSITSGTGLDTEAVPCFKGIWHDQHNAWLTYGALLAGDLNANWMLSSVSGIGIYRTWNKPGPDMLDVYENTYLTTDSTHLWNFKSYTPDLVTICLGTNDFSNGDKSYDRAPIDSATFVTEYIKFIKKLRGHYPKAQIVCLSSPVFRGVNVDMLSNYLTAIVSHMNNVEKDRNIHKYIFSGAWSSGCSGHPNAAEHRIIADELLPFVKDIMNWN